MYRIESLDVTGDVRADEVFFPRAVICVGGTEPPPRADVVLSIEGEVIATREVQPDPGKCVTVTPPGTPGARLTGAGWLTVYDDGGVVPTAPGPVELAVSVAGRRETLDLTIMPSRGRVVEGDPLTHGKNDHERR